MSYNYITNQDSPNYTKASDAPAVFGQARIIKGITIHHYGDPSKGVNPQSVVNYLCRANGNTSAHFVATGDGRKVWCIVAPQDVAWHSGNARGNATTIGIECDPRCRDEDYDVVAELVADIRSAYGDVPIYSHNMWTSTSCPGNYDINRIDQMSYTKFSAPVEWGQGGDIHPKAPTPPPAPVVPAPVPTPTPPTSPTTQDPVTGQPLPDTGKPVTEKDDYSEENNTLLKQILAIVQAIFDKLTSIFK